MGALKSKLKQSADVLEILGSKTGHGSGGNKKTEDPDEKWSNLYRERQRSHLYKWVHTNGTGELIDIYKRDGEEGIHQFGSEALPPWLYNDGIMPEILKVEEYIKWRKFMHANLTGGDDITQSEIQESIGGQFIDHTALWRLNKRGIDGETLIHLLLSQDDARCTEIVKILLRIYPSLAADIYEGEEFYGQSPLHLAIVHDDYEMVQVLVEAGADITQRAIGKFFIPEDQKRIPKARLTNYWGFAYYGEYPLAFAASFGNKDIYDFLIQHGADPNGQDSYGNTVLHMCVINNSIEMYSYAVRHWAKPADVNICNLAGYTPLTLATILGRREIFEAMLELTKVEFWRFSDITYSAYPLTTLDTIRSDGSTNWDSAVMRVIHGTTSDHLEIVGSEVIQRLLADKWRLFGGRKMYERLAFGVLHIFCLSLAIYTRPERAEDLLDFQGPLDAFRYCGEGATLIFTLIYLLYQQTSEIRAQGLSSYWRSVHQAPEKGINLFSNIVFLFCVPCRIFRLYTAEELFLAVALPGFWLSLLFFAKGFLNTGPFVVMIYSMVAGDMVRFGILSLIFLVSFSQAFFFLGKDIHESLYYGKCRGYDKHDTINDYEMYMETALTLLRMSMGGYDYEKLYCAQYQAMTKLLFILYMIIMPIMLINMLIAMMGNTYERVISHAEKAWRQQWAQIVILLERSLDKKELAKMQGEYSIKLNDDRGDDNGDGGGNSVNDIHGLMVIKRTKQTRAQQRKQATSGWKRLGRKVFAMMRNHGVDKTRRKLHRGAVAIDTRPPSAAGMLVVPAGATGSRKGSNFAIARDSRTSSIQVDESQKISRMSLTREPSIALPEKPMGVGSDSPKLMVHVPRRSSHKPLDQGVLLRKLSILEPEYQNQETQHSVKDGQDGTGQKNTGGSKETNVIDDIYPIPLSSPCSVSDAPALDAVFNDSAGQSPENSVERRVSTGSVQLQAMTLEQLPDRPLQKSNRQKLSSRKIESAHVLRRRPTSDLLTVERGASEMKAKAPYTGQASDGAESSATTAFNQPGDKDGQKRLAAKKT